MKKLIRTLTLFSTLAALAHADFVYSVPGMESPKSTASKSSWGTDFQPNEVLGHHAEYRVTGISWSIQPGSPEGSTRVLANGNFIPRWAQARINSFYMQIGGRTILSLSDLTSTTFTNINQASSGTKDFSSSPIIIKNQDIHFSGNFISSMKDNVTVSIQVHGVALKKAPTAYGELDVTSYVLEGAKPTVKWLIGRDSSTGTNNSNNSTRITSTTTPGETITNPTTSETSNNSGVCSPATNCAEIHSNNGTDGVYVSNPNKLAQKWHDPSGAIDDGRKGSISSTNDTSSLNGPSWK